jgi:hypothetical protein
MTTNHHTAITTGAVANAATVNDPLEELDSALTDTRAYAPDEFTGTNSDNTDNDVSNSAHGFAPKLSDVSTEYLGGDGNWTVPAGTGASIDGHAITDEGGASLPQRANLDFIGASVTASNGVSATEIAINGAVLSQNVETLAANKTLTDSSSPIQSLDPGGAARDITLPAEAATNPYFIIYNAGSGGDDLTVKNDSPATIATIADGEMLSFVSDGVSWRLYASTAAEDITIADAGDIITATNVEEALQEIALDGELPVCDDSSIDDTLDAWNAFKPLLDSHVNAGTIFEYPVVSTYSLAYTVASAYFGGVLSPNGDIHFVPLNATVGQKISSAGVVSTYSLVYTVAGAYTGGVLAPNGDIHFVPCNATVGQKISSAGVVSTYSLVYTVAAAYFGGVLSPNGDIHFVPRNATVGQKISTLSDPLPIGVCCASWYNKF